MKSKKVRVQGHKLPKIKNITAGHKTPDVLARETTAFSSASSVVTWSMQVLRAHL